MHPSANKGNNPELWMKLLDELDEKLQLGLLEKLRSASAYHFEDETLYIHPANADDEIYLTKRAVVQQLRLFAETTTNVTTVKIEAAKS